jgi:hypothetical protein
MQCGHDQGFQVWPAMRQELGLFFLAKEPNSPIIFTKRFHLFHRVFAGFSPGDGYGKQILRNASSRLMVTGLSPASFRVRLYLSSRKGVISERRLPPNKGLIAR